MLAQRGIKMQKVRIEVRESDAGVPVCVYRGKVAESKKYKYLVFITSSPSSFKVEKEPEVGGSYFLCKGTEEVTKLLDYYNKFNPETFRFIIHEGEYTEE